LSCAPLRYSRSLASALRRPQRKQRAGAEFTLAIPRLKPHASQQLCKDRCYTGNGESDAVSFTSSYFEIEPNEDEKTNPGIHGWALARWIKEQLREKGITPKEVIAEDWGWCVIAKTKPVRVNIAVANLDGSSTRWRVFVFAERGVLQLLKGANHLKREVAVLRDHLAAIVATIPDVRDISWEPLD
jgi:hypothetical protein